MLSYKTRAVLYLSTLLVTLSPFALGQVELVFRQNDPPQVAAGVAEAVEEWNAANPDVQVRFETVPWSDALNQFVREAQAGSGPDVLQTAFVWTSDLAEAGLITELGSFAASDPPGNGLDDFLGLDLGEFEDGVYGVPWSVDTFALGYRPDLLSEAGVDAFPDTWDALKSAAEILTSDTDGNGRTDQYGFCFTAGSGSNGGMWFLANYYLWSQGKFLVEEGNGGWQVGVTPEDIAEAIRYFNDFFEQGFTPRDMIGVSSWSEPTYVNALGRGDCTIVFLPPPSFQSALESSDAPLLSGLIPRGSEARRSHLGGRALVINANTDHPEAAWKFLTYLTTQSFYQDHYSSYFPSQKTLLETLEFPEPLQAYADMLPNAITFKQYSDSPAPVSGMWAATNREFGAVYSGQKDPERAAEDLIRELNDLLAQ